MSAGEFLTYVPRDDLGNDETIQSMIMALVKEGDEKENVAIIGFPGIGKSTLARAVAAQYQVMKKKPALILAVDPTGTSSKSGLALIRLHSSAPSIYGKLVGIPIVTVPSLSIDGKQLVSQIAQAMNSLDDKIAKIEKILSKGQTLKDKVDLIKKNEQYFADFIDFADKARVVKLIEDFTEIAADSFSYVRLAISIIKKIRGYLENTTLDKLEVQDLLVVIDEISDLGSNQHILSPLYKRLFHYLLVVDITDPGMYLELLTSQRPIVNDLLKRIGVQITIEKRIVLQPPSSEVFNKIMNANNIEGDRVKKLENNTGANPAIAIMADRMYEGIEALEQFFRDVQNQLGGNNLEFANKKDHKGRLLFAVNAAKVLIYEKLYKENRAYLALCLQPQGVAVDEIALFCGCKFGTMVIPPDDKYLSDVASSVFQGKSKDECCKPLRNSGITQDEGKVSLRDPCDHKLDEKLVDCTEEMLNHMSSIAASAQSNNTALQYDIAKYHKSRPVYSLGRKLQHLPLFLLVLENVDKNIREEVENGRKTLLSTMAKWHSATKIMTVRMVYAAHWHLDDLHDLNDVRDASNTFLSVMNDTDYPSLDASNIAKKL